MPRPVLSYRVASSRPRNPRFESVRLMLAEPRGWTPSRSPDHSSGLVIRKWVFAGIKIRHYEYMPFVTQSIESTSRSLALNAMLVRQVSPLAGGWILPRGEHLQYP